MSKLASRKREMFAIEVAAMTPLATAYVLAGYADTPWARYNASKLAHVPEVAARIDELQAEFSERSGIYAEYIQRKLLPLIEANPKDLYVTKDDGKGHKVDRLRLISEIPRDLAAAIQKIKQDPETGAITEITLYNKTEAGNVLLRSLGALVDRLEMTEPPNMSEGDFLGEIERALGQVLGIGDEKLLGELRRALSATNVESARGLGLDGASCEDVGRS
jgi:Terminase small subunit